MATATKICKVCGEPYEYCHTFRRVEGVFRWQDVACSPEHGSIYLAEVRASRNESASNVVAEKAEEPVEAKAPVADVKEEPKKAPAKIVTKSAAKKTAKKETAE